VSDAPRRRVAVLASGGGSNLQALLDYADEFADACAYEVALVLSNRADAGALERARRHDVAAHVLADPTDGDALDALLRAHDVALVVLAGYLKLVPAAVTRRFRGRMLNVHPSLLPSFGGPGMYGRRVHAAVLAAGARLSGATVHFVDEVYDRGAIAAQWPVPVLDGDTPERLAERVLRVEHLLLPRIVDRVAAGALTLGDDDRATGTWSPDVPHHVAFALQPDPGRLAEGATEALGAPAVDG
jgi:formyltetrahydrofolate-dependent phosphoribosylglycinamide formyltransferase